METKTAQSANLHLKFPALILLFILILSLISLPSQAAPATAIPTGERLRNLAGPTFFMGFGAEDNFWSLPDAAQYQETARTEFNMLTPGNPLKWETVHPQQNTFNFTPADQHFQFAQTNNMKFHGHTLVWHSQNPGWLTNGSWTAATLTPVLYNHIDTVMGHYVGQVYVWDVVNEAFEENGAFRPTLWYNTLGQQYIELAFQRARAADPAAKLIINDYNVETINSKSTAMYNLAADFVSRGVPIDGVGFQAHLTSSGLNAQSFADNMARFAALGLEVYITELDVRYPTPISQANLTAQATVYGNLMNRCLLQPACKAVQVWGYTDKYSWIPSFFPGEGDALIFDANYVAKPSYYALQSELEAHPRSTPTPCPACPTKTPTLTRTVTLTPTVTPTICLSCTLRLQYKTGDAAASVSQPKPHFRIVNNSTASIPLSQLKARYWYTREGTASQQYNCDYAAVTGSCSNVTGAIVALSPARPGADHYVEVGFLPAAGSIPAGGNSGEIQSRFNKSDWSSYTQTGDYSFDATKTAFADWNYVTLYSDGSLIWGVEPGSGTVTPPPPTNTPTRTNTSVTVVPTNTPTRTNTPVTVVPTNTPTRTNTPATVVPTNTLTRTPTRTATGPTPTRTRTRTPTRTPTGGTPLPTNTPTRTNTPATIVPTSTPTRTPTTGPTPTPTPTTGGACSPVTSTITAPFTFDGAGTFCWQSNNLGGFINSWNVSSLSINGVNATNVYVAAASYPPQIGGYWYVSYNSALAWGHFEAK